MHLLLLLRISHLENLLLSPTALALLAWLLSPLPSPWAAGLFQGSFEVCTVCGVQIYLRFALRCTEWNTRYALCGWLRMRAYR